MFRALVLATVLATTVASSAIAQPPPGARAWHRHNMMWRHNMMMRRCHWAWRRGHRVRVCWAGRRWRY